MDITITPSKLQGSVAAIPSKSQAHRLFLCAALADRPTTIEIKTICDDLAATIRCISSFGAQIEHRYGQAEIVSPIRELPKSVVMNCGESGATLRFLLPIAGALGIDTVFQLQGRLPYRPLSPLWEELNRMGCRLSWLNRNTLQEKYTPVRQRLSSAVTAGLQLRGQIRSGHYRLDGSISSQFASALLMALPLLEGESHLQLVGTLESKSYIDLTLQALSQFGVEWSDFHTSGNQIFQSPGTVSVEGDWSNAAFWLAANALGSDIAVSGLNADSVQGDKAIVALLPQLQKHCTISAANIPDLIPILSVVASANEGAVFTNIRRLRLKESDRVASIIAMLNDLGGKAIADEDTLTVYPCKLSGGIVDAANDHRIAMAAAIASTLCSHPVTILGTECVSKSHPGFWKEFTRLGGKI